MPHLQVPNATNKLHSWQAWHLCDPDAERVFKALKQAGVKLAVVSNFDTRLRPVLRALKCDHWFDAVAVSAEVGSHIGVLVIYHHIIHIHLSCCDHLSSCFEIDIKGI